MGLPLIVFLILFIGGSIGLLYGTHSKDGFFLVFGALFLLLCASGIVYMGGIEINTNKYYDADMNFIVEPVIWNYTDTLLQLFTLALFVISGVCLIGMVGSNSVEKTPADVYHW